jgi:hypothetical protein
MQHNQEKREKKPWQNDIIELASLSSKGSNQNATADVKDDILWSN